MIYTQLIIGISGKRNSGKDTAASMINYILHKGVTKANFQEWITKKKIYDEQYGYCITHFADSLKDICSTVFGINRSLFNDRHYKDEVYYDLTNNIFINDISKTYREITIEDLDKYKFLSTLFKVITSENKIPCVKLRTLLQYIGTDIFRNYISNNIWCKITIRNAVNIIQKYKYCIIPDVRFDNEAKIISNYSNCKTALINIVRNNNSNDNHSSEEINCYADYTIENNDTKLVLFYRLLNIISNIIKS